MKRLGPILFIITLAFSLCTSLISPGQSWAAPNQGSSSGPTYTFQDRTTIIVNYPGVGNNINFVDSNIWDSTNGYRPPVSDTPSANSFCDKNIPGTIGIVIPSNADWSAPTIDGTLNIGTWAAFTCQRTKVSVTVSNPNQVANAKFTWNGDSIQVEGGGQQSFSRISSEPSSSKAYYTSQTNGDCPQAVIRVDQNDSNKGMIYNLRVAATGRGGSGGSAAPSSLNVPSDCVVASSRSVNIGGTPGTTAPGSTGSGGSGSSSVSCDESGFALSWILCPVIGGLADLINGLYKDILYPLLNIDSTQILDPHQGYYQVWSAFRVYGDIFLVIGLLVIVFGESIGGGVIEAYTAKKVLPRLLLAAVLINLSIYLVTLGVDISNVLGHGVYSLIVEPFNQVKQAGGFGLHINFGGEALTAAVVTGGAFWVKAIAAAPSLGGGMLHFMLTSILLPAALVMLAVLITLLIRTALIYLLIFISPVAFALYTVPNTERYYRKWWDMFFRTLMIFPIVGAIFAIANVTAYTLSNTGGVFGELLGLAALFAPPIMIPFAFRFAGGIMGQIQQGIHQRVAAPGLEGLRKYRAQKRQEAFQRLPEGKFLQGNPGGLQGRLNRGLAIGGQLAQGNIEWSREGLRTGVQVAQSLKDQQAVGDLLKDPTYGDVFANDSADRTIRWARDTGVRLDDTAKIKERLIKVEGLGEQHATETADRIRRLNNLHTVDVIAEAATIAEAGTKTGFAGGYDEMAEAINDVAGDDRSKAVRMMAQMRDRAGQASRADLAPSFGTALTVLENLHTAQKTAAGLSTTNQVHLTLDGEQQYETDANGNQRAIMVSEADNAIMDARAKARVAIDESNLETKDPSIWLRGHGNQAKNLSAALTRSVERAEKRYAQTSSAMQAAYNSGDEAQFEQASQAAAKAERELAQKYAEVESLHDSLYTASPEVAKTFADDVLDSQLSVGGQSVSVSDRAKQFKEHTGYKQTRRDWGGGATQEELDRMDSAARAEAERRAQQDQQGP
jgi:hypothetical protein